MSDQTVHVVIGWDDADIAYVDEEEPGCAADTARQFEADIAGEERRRLQAASAEYDDALRGVVEAAGVDDEVHRLRVCCAEWRGEVTAGQVWWDIVVTSDGGGKCWPVRDVKIMSETMEELASARMAALPDRFYLQYGAVTFELIERGRLRVEPAGYGPFVSACFRCGWSRDEHPDQGVAAGESR